jgi:hypothetical protein
VPDIDLAFVHRRSRKREPGFSGGVCSRCFQVRQFLAILVWNVQVVPQVEIDRGILAQRAGELFVPFTNLDASSSTLL